MGWLVVSRKKWLKVYRRFREELDINLSLSREQIKSFERMTKDVLLNRHQILEEGVNQFKAETRVISERSEFVAKRLFELEGKIAALEATHHKVGYVPVDAFKALSEGDVEQMAGVTEKVRDQLRDILSINEQLKAAGDPGVGLEGL